MWCIPWKIWLKGSLEEANVPSYSTACFSRSVSLVTAWSHVSKSYGHFRLPPSTHPRRCRDAKGVPHFAPEPPAMNAAAIKLLGTASNCGFRNFRKKVPKKTGTLMWIAPTIVSIWAVTFWVLGRTRVEIKSSRTIPIFWQLPLRIEDFPPIKYNRLWIKLWFSNYRF